jgi:hypothetical protein
MKHPIQSLLAAASLLTFGPVSLADPGGRPNPPPPPPEAVSACEKASEGDACTVTFGGHEIHGTCATFASGELACRPDGPPPPPPRK